MPGFDERYDPIYQRGHSGQATGAGQEVPRRPEHAPRPGRLDSAASFPDRHASAHHEHSGISEVIPENAGPEHEDPAPARKFNPFLLALWLFGVAVIALGTFAALVPTGFVGMDAFSSNPGPSVWMFILPALAPGILCGGLVCIGLALALHALAWQRR